MRYNHFWKEPFNRAISDHLADGVRILDIGSGRAPSIAVDRRPPRCEYVGLDISAEELAAAGAAAYDEIIVADVTCDLPELHNRFDLAISWQVLEHVQPLALAADNIRGYLRDGGTFVSLLSGAYAAYAVANRLLPDRLGQALVTRTMRRSPDASPVFPARYDRCYASGLRHTFSTFSVVTVTPFYRAANYFGFSRSLMKTYLAYENVIARRPMENLATHYLLVAKR